MQNIIRATPPPFRKMPVSHVVAWSIFTLGLYAPIWFLQQRQAFNALQTNERIGKALPLAITALYCTSYLVLLVYFFHTDAINQQTVELLDQCITLVGSLMSFSIVLKMRRMLLEHTAASNKKIEVSQWKTVVLFIYYLQYVINNVEDVPK